MKIEEKIDRLERRLDELDRHISAFTRHMEHSDPGARAAYEEQLEELRAHRSSAGERLAEARVEEAESWADDDFEAAIINVFDRIGGRVEHMVERLGGTTRKS